jgi:uncharacterized protein YndB with AHSA1/START domain
MFWIGVLIGVIGVSVFFVSMIASRIPMDHRATVRAHFAAPPDRVWAIIHDPLAAATWRADIKTVERRPDIDGRLAWRETGKHGAIDYVMDDAQAPTRQTTRITNTDLPYGGKWEYTLTAAGGGTDLSITERGFVKPALFRLLSRFVFGYTATLEAYLRALGTHLGESTTPTIVDRGR